MIFNYPVTSPTTSVTLPDPLLGNIVELTPQRVNTQTRVDTRIVFADDAWNDELRYDYKFDGLTDQQRDDMADFIDTTLGREIEFTDHTSTVRTGIIVNPNGEFSQVLRECGHTFELSIRET